MTDGRKEGQTMTILTHALCIIGAFAVAISIHAPE